ncbi:glutamine-hydrolyzing carbamoyl-phosphate synthase small subunit [Candidatus Margulisiibacteriota bacterium]
MNKAKLIFEDGTVFNGKVFAKGEDCAGEVVFNTSMTGYQEILTDPSYCGQMVLMTYPLIGNYGVNNEDIESRKIFLKAFLVREYLDFPSNWRSTKSLKSYLEENNILGVEDLDTRAITRYIREKGAQKAMLTTSDKPDDQLLKELAAFPGIVGQNLVQQVTCDKPYIWEEGKVKSEYKVAVIDCGVKYNILRLLTSAGCKCFVFPASVKAVEILADNFDGVFISNGPGDPEPVKEVITTIQNLLGKIPMFGICLGNQLLGLALGGKTYKLKFGHHSANHPVKHLKTGQVEITSQNHGFCLDMDSLNKKETEITHLNLNDNTVEGFKHKNLPAFAVQYHPEASPGPHDSHYLFEEFIKLIKNKRKKT